MNIAVIFAGGVGTRMRSKERPKQFLEIYNKPIIVHTLEHFETTPQVDAVVISCVEEWMDYLRELVFKYRLDKVKNIVPGGETGQLSIYHGLLAAKALAEDEPSVVMIHDGVRPLITSELIAQNIQSVRENGSAITCAVVKETIVEIHEDGGVKHIPARSHSRVAKAPQSFWLDDILTAHHKALADGYTNFIDSCTMMQHYGYALHTVDGPYENIKITTPDDFYTMRAILQAKEDAQIYGLD